MASLTLFQIDEKIHQFEGDLANAAPGSSKEWLASQHDILSDLYFMKSLLTRDPVDGESAETHGRGAIELGHAAASHITLPGEESGKWWVFQGSRLEKQFLRFKGTDDLMDAAIDAFEKAIQQLPEESPLLREAMSNQANCFSARFDAKGNVTDVDRAIEISTTLTAAGTSEANMSSIHNNMAINYLSRFEKLRNLDDLEQANRWAEATVEETGDEDPNLPTRLLNLANCRCMLFEEDDEIEHVNKALQELEKAATLSRALNLACLPQVLSKRARAMYLRYIEQKDAGDMQQAIALAKEALAAAPSDQVENTRNLIVLQLASFLSAVDENGRPFEFFQEAILRGEVPLG
jgi:tetratricopeptide (TPR) repeat protein